MSGIGSWWRVVRAVMAKELTDGIRDRRSVMSALLFPLVGPVLIAVMFSTIVQERSHDRPLQLPVAGAEHAPALVEHLEATGVEVVDAPADAEAAVDAGDVDLVLVVPPTYAEDFRASKPVQLELVIDSSRREAQAPIERVRRRIDSYGGRIGSLRLLARGVQPDVAQPLRVVELDVATPARRAANILTMVPMFVMLAAFIGGMFLATDGTAGERERKSLEPLLLNPVSRVALVTGKWLATTAFSMVGVLITLAGSVIALSQVPLEEVGLSLQFDAVRGLVVLACVLPLCPLAAGVQLWVASFARSFREAQTYLSLLTLAPALPGVWLTLEPVKTAAWMMAVPVLGQQALLMDVLRGDWGPAGLFALAGAVAVLAAVGCVAATSWLFGRERIIFGG